MYLFEQKRFVSSATIIGVIMLEALKRLFKYSRNSRGPKMDPCGTPHALP